MSFTACLVTKDEQGNVSCELAQLQEQQLLEGEVRVELHYSSMNYKDALAVTGRGAIIRKFPLVAGIDLAGEVIESRHADFQPGDLVLTNGCGLGEHLDGGLAEQATVNGDWLIKLANGLTPLQGMAVGTAGFTAALALHRMQHNGQTPETGPIVVTGASGGVGNMAISMFSQSGYEVIAVSNRAQFHEFLTQLGASSVVTTEQLNLSSKWLSESRFGGVVDNVGGEQLANLVAHVNPWGNVASIGLADNPKLDMTVFPLILRGVSLLGVSAANCPVDLQKQIWHRIAHELLPEKLQDMVCETIGLEQVIATGHAMLDRQKHGRIVVDCRKK